MEVSSKVLLISCLLSFFPSLPPCSHQYQYCRQMLSLIFSNLLHLHTLLPSLIHSSHPLSPSLPLLFSCHSHSILHPLLRPSLPVWTPLYPLNPCSVPSRLSSQWSRMWTAPPWRPTTRVLPAWWSSGWLSSSWWRAGRALGWRDLGGPPPWGATLYR